MSLVARNLTFKVEIYALLNVKQVNIGMANIAITVLLNVISAQILEMTGVLTALLVLHWIHQISVLDLVL